MMTFIVLWLLIPAITSSLIVGIYAIPAIAIWGGPMGRRFCAVACWFAGSFAGWIMTFGSGGIVHTIYGWSFAVCILAIIFVFIPMMFAYFFGIPGKTPGAWGQAAGTPPKPGPLSGVFNADRKTMLIATAIFICAAAFVYFVATARW